MRTLKINDLYKLVKPGSSKSITYKQKWPNVPRTRIEHTIKQAKDGSYILAAPYPTRKNITLSIYKDNPMSTIQLSQINDIVYACVPKYRAKPYGKQPWQEQIIRYQTDEKYA